MFITPSIGSGIRTTHLFLPFRILDGAEVCTLLILFCGDRPLPDQTVITELAPTPLNNLADHNLPKIHFQTA